MKRLRRRFLFGLVAVVGLLMLLGSRSGPSPADRASYCSPIWHPARYCVAHVYGVNFDRRPPWVHT